MKTLIFATINLIIFIFILGYFTKNHIRDFFKKRSELIRKTIYEAKILKDKALEKFTFLQKRVDSIEQEKAIIFQETQENGKSYRERLIKEAEDISFEIRSETETLVRNEFEMGKKRLQQEMLQEALLQAKEDLKKRLTSNDHQRLVQEYIDKLATEVKR